MKKILILLLLLIPLPVLAIEFPSTYSKNVLIYDLTDDKEIYSHNKEERSYIASLTKIITTMTALEKIEDMNQKVTITSNVFSGLPWDASLAGLKTGDVLTYQDLLYASILPSGADATQALAINLSGSVSNFVDDMNSLAKKIGMKNSTFKNVTGLDIDNHYSTLEDILILLKYALKNEAFRKIYTTKQYTLSNNLTVKSTITTYNKMMNLDVSRIIGSKTGYTSKAGLCISALFNSNGHELLLISTGAEYIYGNFYNLRDALNIIKFMDNNYNNQKLLDKDKTIVEIPVKLSKTDSYTVTPNNDIFAYLPNDYDVNLFSFKYEGKEVLNYKNKNGEDIGIIKYYYDNELIQEDNVVLDTSFKISFLKIIWKYRIAIIIIIIGLIIIRIRRKNKKRRRRKKY